MFILSNNFKCFQNDLHKLILEPVSQNYRQISYCLSQILVENNVILLDQQKSFLFLTLKSHKSFLKYNHVKILKIYFQCLLACIQKDFIVYKNLLHLKNRKDRVCIKVFNIYFILMILPCIKNQ
jgi:hypothetical protein